MYCLQLDKQNHDVTITNKNHLSVTRFDALHLKFKAVCLNLIFESSQNIHMVYI